MSVDRLDADAHGAADAGHVVSSLALNHWKNYLANDKKLGRMHWAYFVALLCLLLQTASLFAARVAGGSPT